MAEEKNEPVSQGAIPPKAVPPQVRPATEGNVESPTVRRQAVNAPGGTATPVPRTVRLKPVSVVSPEPDASGASSASAAAEAVKRMTARIAMMAEPETGKKRTGQIPPGGAPGARTPTIPIPPTEESEMAATVKKVTARIQMSSTGPIPELPNAPRTIKIRPQVQTQQIPAGEPPAAAVGPSGTQPVPGKAKTSRIPLESAMAVPTPSEPAQEEEATGSSPKTIKLKRPGEMSTVKVSVHGGGAPQAADGSAADSSSITQKKTIRVKRPMAPAAASMAEGGEAGEAGGSAAVMTPIAYAPAPERGTGWFIALSVACILLILGLVGIFAVQLFGSRPHTEIDPQFQKG